MPIIKNQNYATSAVIDLDGSDGNAFVLMGYVSKFGKQLGWTTKQIDECIEKMMSGDYANLVKTMNDELHDVVTFVTTNDELIQAINEVNDELK